MKANRSLFILFATSLLTVAGCGGGGSTPVELTKYQKVDKAFAAVARTLDLKSSNKQLSIKPNRAINIHGDMTEFESYFANASTDEKIEDQIDLNSPPFMQFQYLKIIYETIGANYSFGTKYSYPITGDVYIDFETGYQDKERAEENKYSFTFDFSIFIEIDENDLITSEVGMGITLVKGQNSYKNYKYAYLVLDYDFEKNDDNYELALYDFGQEKDMPYLDCDFGYEYDYCLVSNNKLTEWRKFRYEADRKMVKDAAHPTLDSYLREGAVITGDNQRWYKNNVLKRVDSKTDDSLLIAKELYRSFGLNDTDIDTESYFSKESTNSIVIKTIYDRASSEYGDELIYHVIAKKEDDNPEDKGWPIHEIEQITGMNTLTFSDREGITYEYYRNDVDGQSASVVITVIGANAGEYAIFENKLVEEYGFTFYSEESYSRTYFLNLIDNTYILITVSVPYNSIAITHYFGGGVDPSPYEPILLDNMITYDLPYNYYSQNFYSVEKDALSDLANILDNQQVQGVFSNKIDLNVSKKIEIGLSDKDIEYVGGADTLKEARDNVMNMYGNYYVNQWKGVNIQNGFMNDSYRDLVVLRPGESDGVFFIYFLRCVDDTLIEFLRGEPVITYINVEIYLHNHQGEVFLYDTLNVQENENVWSYLDSSVKHYLDYDLTVLLTDDNCYAYEGMVLHRRDYDDPEYEKIEVPGGINYEYAYSWYNTNEMDEESIYNRVMNLVGDYNIRSYLEGKIAQSEDANNTFYEICIGPEIAESMDMTVTKAAQTIYNQYAKEYNGWKKGTKGNYFYLNDGKEEDVVFFDTEHLEEGFINFIHIHLTSPVMANYESGSQGGGGDVPATTQVIVLFYKDGMFDTSAIINCPIGEDVRPYLMDFEGDFYRNSSFSVPLDDSNCTVTEGMIIYVNVTSSSQEEYTTIYVIINGEDGRTNVIEVRAIVGDDAYDYVSAYGDELYLDAEYKQELKKGECPVRPELVVYVKPNSGGGEIKTGLVNVYIYQDGALINSHIFDAPIGDDVRGYLDGYDTTGTRYVDSSFSILLDGTNCAIYDGMNIYILHTTEPQEENVTVQLFFFNSSGDKLGYDTLSCPNGADVRNYIRGYDGDAFLDSDFSTPLTEKNCKAYQGMTLYIVLRNK